MLLKFFKDNSRLRINFNYLNHKTSASFKFNTYFADWGHCYSYRVISLAMYVVTGETANFDTFIPGFCKYYKWELSIVCSKHINFQIFIIILASIMSKAYFTLVIGNDFVKQYIHNLAQPTKWIKIKSWQCCFIGWLYIYTIPISIPTVIMNKYSEMS